MYVKSDTLRLGFRFCRLSVLGFGFDILSVLPFPVYGVSAVTRRDRISDPVMHPDI